MKAVIALDQRVRRARAVLQRTRESDPNFERRIHTLVELVARRDSVLERKNGPTDPLLPPAA